jgi:hypothetical protein
VRSITGAVSSATLTLTVEPFIPPPYAENDVAALGQDGTVTIEVLANDLFDGTGLRVEAVGNTAGGSVVINDDGDGRPELLLNRGFAGPEVIDIPPVDSLFLCDRAPRRSCCNCRRPARSPRR